MAFNWDDEQDGEFRDIPDEVNNGQEAHHPVINAGVMNPPKQRPAAHAQAPVEVEYQELPAPPEEEETEEETENFEADANLRIELATLYKMIMNHDLFEGMDADPRAVEVVTKGIRKFAREQVEIMLGMRAVAPKTAIVSSPFNDLEVMVLKKLASTYSKGATESAEAAKPQPAAKAIARREGLNTISAPKPVAAKKPASKPAPLATKPTAPVQRQARPAAPVVEESKPLTKPIHEMTPEEFEQRNKEATARQEARKPAKSAIAIPQPTPDQEEMFHTHRAVTSDNPLSSPNAVSAIISALNRSKSQ